jgi:sec-independent protein translocase protein TatC
MLKLSRQQQKTPPPMPSTPADEVADGEGARMGFFEHIEELRQRLTRAVLGLLVGVGISLFFTSQLMEYLITPLNQRLVESGQTENLIRLQTLGPTEGVVSYFRVALLMGGIIAIPVITYQVLAFILPGLTDRESRFLMWSILPVTILFLVGVAFAWFLMVPAAIDFLQNFQSQIFMAEWTANEYLGFITALVFWMGVAFETPLVFFTLSVMGFVTAGSLIRNWRFAIIGAAVAAAMITPTVDPANMALVMVPLLGLYVLSILLVAIGTRINRNRNLQPA